MNLARGHEASVRVFEASPETEEGFAERTLDQVTAYIRDELEALRKNDTGKGGLTGTKELMRLMGSVFMGQADSLTYFMKIDLPPNDDERQTSFVYKWDAVEPNLRARQTALAFNDLGGYPVDSAIGFETEDILRMAGVLRDLGIKEKNG